MTYHPTRRAAPSRGGPEGAAGAAIGRLPRLRTHLRTLVVAVLLPALAFGTAASWQALRQGDAVVEARLLDTARALAAAVDRQIAGQIAALQVLAASPDAEIPEDLPHFAQHARTTAEIFGGWVAVFGKDGEQLLNTLLPAGGTLPSPGGAIGPAGGGAAVRRVFETGRPFVSDVALGRVSGQLQAFTFVPVGRDGEVRQVVGMPLRAEQLSATLAMPDTSGRGVAALTDGRGVFAARSRNAAEVIGQSRPVRDDAMPIGDSGVLQGRSVPDGAPIRTAYQRLSAAPGWHVWVNEPEAAFAAARRGPLLALAGGAALALGIGLLIAAALGRRLLRPVEALVAHAEAVASGGALDEDPRDPVRPAGIAELERLRLAVGRAEAALRRVQRIGRVGGFDIDLRTGLNRRSAEYMDLQGRSARMAQERHEDWVRRLHPDDRDRAEARYLAAIADGAAETEYAQEYRIVTPTGEVRWIYARAEIERDAAGRAIRMVGAHVDVTALKTAEAALRDSEERLRLALEAAQLGAWELDLRTGTTKRTPRAREIAGVPAEGPELDYPAWLERIHPEDRDSYDRAVAAVRAGRQAEYRLQYRFSRADGRLIWVESQGRAAGRDAATGEPVRLIGTVQDITTRKEAEERQAVLIHELDHRAKNTLAVVQAALRLTPRTEPEVFARVVEGRVSALARAHTLLAKARWRGAELRAVAEDALAPFLGTGSGAPQAEFRGPPVALSPGAVQALSMAFHELATNAAKHGALSVPGGRVEMGWQVAAGPDGQTLRLAWSETGGPAVAQAPTARGFGSSLILATVTRQLGGRVEATWRPAGLLWEAALPMSRLSPGGEGADAPLVTPEPPERGQAAQSPVPAA